MGTGGRSHRGGGEGGILGYSNSKCQVLTKFSFSGKRGGGSGYSKLKVPSSDQIFMGRGVFLATQNSNCQVMPKFPLENFAKNRVLSS